MSENSAAQVPESSRPGPFPLGRVAIGLGIAAAGLVALALRSVAYAQVVREGGGADIALHDAAYHARRAFYSFVNFPEVLYFDRFIAYPDGALVPMPPLYDWGVAGLARLLGDSPATFEWVAAWVSPVASSLCVVPIFVIGRRFASAGIGLGAAWIFALLPASTLLSQVGNFDHHAAVSLLVAGWLASSMVELRPDPLRNRRWDLLAALIHGLIVAAMLLVWSGSLLYLAVGEGARLVVAAVVGRRPDRLWAQAGTALFATALVVPWLWAGGDPPGGRFTTTTLSWIHPLVLVSLSLLTGILAYLEPRWPQPSAVRRAFRTGLLAGLIALGCLAFSDVRQELISGAGFLAKQDGWAAVNPEQQPLFGVNDVRLARPAHQRFGYFAFLLPLAPLLLALRLRSPDRRAETVLMLVWTSVLTALALLQLRFAHDFSVPGSVFFAWIVAVVTGWVARRLPGGRRTAMVLTLVVGVGMLWPAISRVHTPRVRGVLAALVEREEGSRPRLTAKQSLLRFCETIRQATPEISGYLDSDAVPEYGIIVPVALGHTFLWCAQRPIPANNFGPYLDAEKMEWVQSFFAAPDEQAALRIAERLRARYVFSQATGRLGPGAFAFQLHMADGSARGGHPHLEHFRLVTEGPKRGSLLPAAFRGRIPKRIVPYKLFELVEGAEILASGVPGAKLVAELKLVTPIGRRLRYRATAMADDRGVARLRIPLATDGSDPVRALGPYRVYFEGYGDEVQLDVPDQAIRRGAVLEVRLDGGEAG
ncbi:MAG: hypothetical protein GY910_04880 [bacterium]|nr:hypothetical protein [Deltaproteobacteria bacterium]MCP4904296.1 hypothetical protein [bacterium]